jgi:hypothetical protein
VDSETKKLVDSMTSAFLHTVREPLIPYEYEVGNNNLLTSNFLSGIESLNDQSHKVNGGIDILFSGCSITMGAGLNQLSDSWSYLLYKNIKKDLPVNGYKNISMGGSSVIDIVINVIKYIYSYEAPKYIFLLLPNFGRDMNKFCGNAEISNKMTYNIYHIFEQICKDKNIKAYAYTWSDGVFGVTDWMPSMDEYHSKEIKKIFLEFDSFYQINKKDFANNVFSYTNNNKDSQGMIGTDDSHPGPAIHFGYYKEMERIYNAS